MPGKNSTRNVPEPGRVWNLNDIQELLDLLAGKEITEFEMEQQGVKIRVLRGNSHPVNAGMANGYVIAPGSAPVAPVQPQAPALTLATVPPPPAAVGSEPAAES